MKDSHLRRFQILLCSISLIAILSLTACSQSRQDPLKALSRELDHYPEYSVILDDMEISGNFFKSYYHKYKVLYAESVDVKKAAAQLQTSDRSWIQVDRDFFDAYESYLGMAVLTKTGEEAPSRVQQPPGYQYVGDSRYGSWQRNQSGGSFWIFYGQYSLLRNLLGAGTSPIRRSHWNDYRTSYSRGRPYYGSGSSPSYGTRGSHTKTRHPSFFERQQLRQTNKRQKFSQRVSNRTGRTQSRGSGRFGGK